MHPHDQTLSEIRSIVHANTTSFHSPYKLFERYIQDVSHDGAIDLDWLTEVATPYGLQELAARQIPIVLERIVTKPGSTFYNQQANRYIRSKTSGAMIDSADVINFDLGPFEVTNTSILWLALEEAFKPSSALKKGVHIYFSGIRDQEHHDTFHGWLRVKDAIQRFLEKKYGAAGVRNIAALNCQRSGNFGFEFKDTVEIAPQANTAFIGAVTSLGLDREVSNILSHPLVGNIHQLHMSDLFGKHYFTQPLRLPKGINVVCSMGKADQIIPVAAGWNARMIISLCETSLTEDVANRVHLVSRYERSMLKMIVFPRLNSDQHQERLWRQVLGDRYDLVEFVYIKPTNTLDAPADAPITPHDYCSINPQTHFVPPTFRLLPKAMMDFWRMERYLHTLRQERQPRSLPA